MGGLHATVEKYARRFISRELLLETQWNQLLRTSHLES
jgi:hypothetical protein